MRISMKAPSSMADTSYGFWLRTISPPGVSLSTVQVLSNDGKDDVERIALPEGRYGTAGIISITPKKANSSSGWSKIRWIKLGFNDEFEPVCLLANSGFTNSRLNTGFFNQAVALSPESKLRQQMFDQTWIKVMGGGAPRIATGWPSGFSVIGFRVNGCSVTCDALNLQLSVRLLPDPRPISSAGESPVSPRKVWVVDITDLGGSSPEVQHYCSQWQYCGSWMCGVLFALFLCPSVMNSVEEERREALEQPWLIYYD